MDKRRVVLAVGLGVAALLTVQTITASNMGFKLNKQLAAAGTGGSKLGRNMVALPDNRQSGMNNAKAFIDDMGLAQVQRIERYKIETDNTYEFYSGRSLQSGQVNFALTPGEGYRVRMNTTTNYIIVGSDNPATGYNLYKAGDNSSKLGRNMFAYNYHQTAINAKAMLDEIGLLSVQRIERYKIDTDDTYEFYSGRTLQSGQVNFPLVPGEAYRIRMNTTVTYTPAHY